MALPIYLAMTASEMSSSSPAPKCFAYMACHFSPYSQGLSNLPASLPEKAILILNDSIPCQGHCPGLITDQLSETIEKLHCESLLLDFQRPPEPEAMVIVKRIVEELPCPVAVFEAYAREFPCPVFLPPAPLHLPLEAHLAPWKGRDIWLEAALCQEDARVKRDGCVFVPHFPPSGFRNGFFDKELTCHYLTKAEEDAIVFTLFDTPESLEKKLSQAQALGVTRAVGLWQELGTFLTGKESAGRSIAETSDP